VRTRDVLLAIGWLVAVTAGMVAVAAFDPMSWHARDAGYPSVPVLVALAVAVLVAGAAATYVARNGPRACLLLAGVAGIVAGTLGNVAGILTIHAMGGGNSAADIWSYLIIWYVGNPADASIAVGALLLLVWVARLVTRRAGERLGIGVMAGVAALPLLVAGSYGVARNAEITGWQPPPVEQLARVVAHRAGLSESKPSRACASQFAHVYHRPRSVELTAAYCPAVLRYAGSHERLEVLLVRSAPLGTFGNAASRAGPAKKGPHYASEAPKRPSVSVRIGQDGSITVTASPPPVVSGRHHALSARETRAQGSELPCVEKALRALAPTPASFAALVVESACRPGGR